MYVFEPKHYYEGWKVVWGDCSHTLKTVRFFTAYLHFQEEDTNGMG